MIMWTDPIIEEIHKVRQEHAAKFEYDLLAIVRNYQKRQKLSGKKVISFAKKSSEIRNIEPKLEKIKIDAPEEFAAKQD